MSRPNNRRIIFGTVLALMVGLILFVSFLPVGDKRILHTRGRFHPLGHLLAFASIGFVAVMMPKTFRGRILFIAGLLLFAFAIEFGEHLIFLAPMEWTDVLMDFMGVFCGILLALVSRPQADFVGRF
jgi:hypothetical protein